VRCSLQDIFIEHFPRYAQTRALHPREWRAALCISRCYTSELGAHVLTCPEGHYERVQWHACRHRSCPRCVEPARTRWVEAQKLRLLPCAHFHTVFTLPHELLALWSYNREQMTQLLFEAARDSLLQLMADPRRLGVLPGLLMSLHTWGRNLSMHPHLHCLVTAGGLNEQGQWKDSCTHVPVSALPLKALFRGKFLSNLGALLKHRRLSLPPEQDRGYWHAQIRSLWRKDFHVEVCDVYEHGRGVMLYLARYVKGGPLPKDRPLWCDEQQVAFDYTDHRDGKTKRMRMPVMQFVGRMLWHAPPKGQHVTRHAGLYGTARARQHDAALRALMDAQPALWPRAAASADPPPLPPEAPRCPSCRVTLLRRLRPRATHQGSENSLAAVLTTHSRAPPLIQRRPTLRSTATRCGMPPWRRKRESDHRSRRQGGMPQRAR
jgi:hypothetical protein